MRYTLTTILFLAVVVPAPVTASPDASAVTATVGDVPVETREQSVIEPGTLLNGTWVVVKAGTQNVRQVKTSDDSVVWVVPAPVVHPGSTGSGAAPKGARVAALIPMPNRDSRSP
ncbi:MAG: hypothetical protein D6761_02980, partial [Candidatus Dadabacteria bacterium]